jgi:hypothetical protein
MINKFEEGSGVAMVIYIDGKFETFKLSVIERKARRPKGYEYGFVNEDQTKYFHGPYSGGITGFGISQYEIRKIDEEWGKEYKVITTDLDCIQALANAEEVKAKLAEEEAIRKTEARVKAINALPKTFSVIPELDEEFEFVRSDASCLHGHGIPIKGGHIRLRKKRDEGSSFESITNRPYLTKYISKDRKLLVKKFDGDMKWLFGEKIAFANNPKDLLTKLVAREEELKNLIAAAK